MYLCVKGIDNLLIGISFTQFTCSKPLLPCLHLFFSGIDIGLKDTCTVCFDGCILTFIIGHAYNLTSILIFFTSINHTIEPTCSEERVHRSSRLGSTPFTCCNVYPSTGGLNLSMFWSISTCKTIALTCFIGQSIPVNLYEAMFSSPSRGEDSPGSFHSTLDGIRFYRDEILCTFNESVSHSYLLLYNSCVTSVA